MRVKFLFQPRAWWLGVHYSQHYKRLCINLLPMCTICVTLKGGLFPAEVLEREQDTHRRFESKVIASEETIVHLRSEVERLRNAAKNALGVHNPAAITARTERAQGVHHNDLFLRVAYEGVQHIEAFSPLDLRHYPDHKEFVHYVSERIARRFADGLMQNGYNIWVR